MKLLKLKTVYDSQLTKEGRMLRSFHPDLIWRIAHAMVDDFTRFLEVETGMIFEQWGEKY